MNKVKALNILRDIFIIKHEDICQYGDDDLIIPYSIAVIFCASLVLTFVGDVFEHACMKKIDIRKKYLIII